MKKIINEFKVFIKRGNVVDLAVAVVVGAAFTAIVNSFANDLIMPLLAIVLNKVKLSDLKWHIKDEIYISYGNFLQAVINFILIAIAVFIIVKVINMARERAKKLFDGLEEVKQKIKEDKPLNRRDMWFLKKNKTSVEKIKEEIKKEEEEKRLAEEEAKKPTLTEEYLEQIRDLLKELKKEGRL